MINFLKNLLAAGHRIKAPNSAEQGKASQQSADANYLSDQPIYLRENDEFNRWPFARRIADTLATRTDSTSLVVGLYGAWGDGKTSVLRLMEQALQPYPDVVVVNFNPWLFGSEERLLRGFFATLASATGKHLTTAAQQIGRLLDQYGALLTFAGAGELAKNLGKSLSTVELEDLRHRLEKILGESRTRIIILIDDIDRLDREEIHTIFKLVKLSASFRHCSYVLAFDDEMVAGALGDKYGKGGIEAGRAFLEKIVQVPLHLPPPDELALRKLAFTGIDTALKTSGISIDQDKVDSFVIQFTGGLEQGMTTPRQAKLYGNALLFAMPLLKGEVNPTELMLIEGIRVFYPKLYATIRDNPDVFLDGITDREYEKRAKERLQEFVNSAIAAAGIADQDAFRRRLLERLFPRLQSIFGNTYWPANWETEWEREQRICSQTYFNRYFSYAIPPGDVSDILVAAVIREAASNNNVATDNLIEEFASRNALTRLVQKLRRQEAQIPAEAIPSLTMTIARNGRLLPRERGMFAMGGTRAQAAILIGQLVRRVTPAQSAEALAKEIVERAQPLPFAVECLRWMSTSGQQGDIDRVVSEDCQTAISKIVADRVADAAITCPPYIEFSEEAQTMLYVWNTFGQTGAVEKFLRARLDTHPNEMADFLGAFVPTGYEMESGVPHRSDLRRDGYDSISRLIDPAFLILRLRERYGPEIDVPEYHPTNNVSVEKRIALQFAFIHNQIEQEKRQRESGDGDGSNPPSQPA